MKKRFNLLVCLVLALMASTISVKAQTTYGQVTGAVHYETADGPAQGGKIYISTSNVEIGSIAEGDWSTSPAVVNINGSIGGYPPYWVEYGSANVYLYALPDEGYEFYGWYAYTWVEDYDWNLGWVATWSWNQVSTNSTYTYDAKPRSEDSGNPTSLPVYAVFGRVRSTYYGNLQVQASNAAGGLVSVRVQTGTDYWGNPQYNYKTYAASNIGTMQTIQSPEASVITSAYTARVWPVRGYQVNWSGDAATTIDPSSATTNSDGTLQISATVTASSTDSENPTIGVLTANLTEATPYVITIEKAASVGTITVNANNSFFNNEGTSISKTTKAVATIDAATTSANVNWYPNDVMGLVAASADAGRYQFAGWYDGDTKLSSSTTYSLPTPTANRTIEARFTESTPLYYAATAETTQGGSVKVSFEEITDLNPGTEGSASGQTDYTFAESSNVTAYFKAEKLSGYEFVGWKESPIGAYVSFEETFSKTFAASSKTSASPTTYTVYADFQPISVDEAQLINGETGAVVSHGNLATVIAASSGKNTLVELLKNINLEAPITINKALTLDFKGYTISGSTSGLITTTANVSFTDNSAKGNGGISVTAETASEVCAVNVSSGKLTFYGGRIQCTNTSDDAAAEAVGVSVSNVATFNLEGGMVSAEVTQANTKAYGVKVNAGATATLTMGSVSATAASDAYGVLANGTTKVTWSVAVNATGNNAVGVLVADAAAVATLDGGSITTTGSTSYGVQATAGTNTTIGGNIVINAGTNAVKQQGAAVVTVETGRFMGGTQEMAGTNGTNLKLYGGYYVQEAGLDTYMQDGVTKGAITSGKFFNDGYHFVLSNGDNPNYVVCTADGKNFSSLEDAITYANNNDKTMTILMKVSEYTLPAGNYTIPAKATLIVPFRSDHTSLVTNPRVDYKDNVSPTSFSKLILASGVKIDVYGKIQMGGMRSAKGQMNGNNGVSSDSYGWLHMNAGSQIVLASGSHFYAWGFVTGAGEIDARKGSTVYEFLQLKDWKGGTCTRDMPQGKAFPFNQYYVQNIECPITFRPGSSEKCAGAVNVYSSAVGYDVSFIGINGTSSLFMMDDNDESEDTWVRKRYNAAKDSLIFEVNNSASLGSIILYGYSSAAYVLPVSNNMRFHVLNGDLEITENVELLPGAEIEVDKKATVTLKSGKSLYVFDADEWMRHSQSSTTYGHTLPIPYFPTWAGNGKTCPRATTITTDASVNVHGTVIVNGSLYTTAGGANIHSSKEDAGTIKFATTAPSEATNVYVNNTTGASNNTPKTANPAWLQNSAEYVANGGDAYLESSGVSGSYCFLDIDGNGARWTNLSDVGCFKVDKVTPADETTWKYYAKPQSYVELSSKNPDNITHLYYSADGNHEYILMDDDCQWWEVEDVPEDATLKHCIHPDNDTYYFWDTSLGTPGWNEKTYDITWNNWDGSPITDNDPENPTPIVYKLSYKSMPQYLGTNPTREMNDYYTYDFIGWLPELAPVTSDMTYTAQFEQKDRKYMITFKDADGSTLEETLWKMGEMPICYNQPTPQGKILVWSPTIHAVNDDAVYTATYIDEAPTAYHITFANWNGTVLQEGDVDVDVVPAYTGATPTKAQIADKAFEFDGWMPDLAPVSEAVVYTAKFREKPAEYSITFMRAVANDGTGAAIDPAEEIESNLFSYGEMPVCSNVPTKTYTGEGNYYYEVVWEPQLSAVTGNATYTATGFVQRAGTCLFTLATGGNGTVQMTYGEPATIVEPESGKNSVSVVLDYGTEVTLTATPADNYHFVRWSDGNTDATRTFNIIATTLRAEFAINQYTITWVLDNGQPNETTVVDYNVVPTHSNPAKATTASTIYNFTGWDPAIVAATENKTYTAQYSETTRTYTIRFVLGNGMEDVVMNLVYDDENVPTIDDPYRAPKNGIEYTFNGWYPTLAPVTANAIYEAQWNAEVTDLKAGNSVDANAKDLALTETGMEAQTLTIEPVGTVNITGSVIVQNFILESNGTQSGQLLGSSTDRLTINEHAYFDLTLNAQRRTWYAVAVPWAVDAENGISIKGGRKLVLGRDFDLVYYQGNVRASEGAGYQCWKYAEDADGDKIMHPGRAYMMYFGSEIETIRFENYDNTPFDDAVLTVGQYDASEAGDANWNGVANPRTYHATLAAGGATYGYYLNNGRVDEYMVGEGEPTYKLVNLASFNAIVGKPLFIQAVNTTPISTTPKIAAAPRRIREIEIEEGIETVYEVTFGAENSANKDNIFIQTVETKEDGYVIGQDLLKAGYNAKLPQIWVSRYGKKLSVNTATPMNGVHNYSLVLNIPQAGDYTIAVEGTQGDTETLYLTKDGSIIWNLSYGAYSGSFEKGENSSYGLRIRKAPQTTTGTDEALVDAQGETKKVIIDDKVFIIRGNQVYSIDGQLVK